jgi:glycosyltransferase involved in cell wall biosynthesis
VLSERNVILLAYYYPPQPASGAARPARFAKYLPEFGCTPKVISKANMDDRAMGPGRWKAVMWSRVCSLIQRAFFPFNENLPWVPYGYLEAATLCAKTPRTTIVSTSPPISTHIAALLLKRKYGVRWIADFRDPMACNPYRSSRRSDLYLPWLEKEVVRHADCVIAVNDRLAAMLQKTYPGQASKIVTIWNGYDPASRLRPASLPSRPYRVLSHIGSLYGDRHPGALLDSLLRLEDQGRFDAGSLKVQLIGQVDHPKLTPEQPPFSTAIERGLVELNANSIPVKEAHDAMKHADYLLLLDLTGKMDVQVPAKVFEYVQIGRPILAFTRRNSPTEFVLSRSGIPHVCIYTDSSADERAARIYAFLNLPSTAIEPSAWFLTEFDARNQTGVLARLCFPATEAGPSS